MYVWRGAGGGPMTDDIVSRPMIKSAVVDREDNLRDVLRVPRL